jgi:outer membrane receptor protein involved in Fe transport
MHRFQICSMGVLLCASVAVAADEAPVQTGAEENIQVTATRYETSAENVPTLTTVLDGQMLRDRGITDLRSALGVVAGVDIAPGGDGGPAASVPEMWGLREFDAFLLVVDDVPWGGAYNPDLAALSLKDVARIEIMRGSAPVMYGATSFIGVIHVIHNAAGSGRGEAQVMLGDQDTFGVYAAIDLMKSESWSSRIAADYTEQGYPDERTDWGRGHVLWRNRIPAYGGNFRADVDLLWLNQSPASPAPRVGTELSPLVPDDANVNPGGSHIDQRRPTFIFGYDHPEAFGSWSVTASYAYSNQEILRGFLAADPAFPVTPARGIRQTIALDEFYLDGHVAFTNIKNFEIVAGVDSLLGRGRTHGGDFDYVVAPDGSDPNPGVGIPDASGANIYDRRAFNGLYGYAAWTPNWRWRVDAGLRLNVTDETRDAWITEFGTGDVEGGTDSRSETRPSGSAGVVFTAWRDGANNVKVFGGYRNTFKPAAMDFGLEAEGEILEPEEGQSLDLGVRTALYGGRIEIEVDAFTMQLKDIVVGEEAAPGVPGIENGGEQKLEGIDIEARGRFFDGLWARFAWSYHDARFEDFVQDFGGVPTQLSGNRLEMSPQDEGALGLIWAPLSGFQAHGEVRYTGSRYLNRRNTALAPSFTSYSAGIGWHVRSFTVRLDGENLSDERDPVAESELADAQYYRLQARRYWASFNWQF